MILPVDKNFFDEYFAKSDGVTTLEIHTRSVINAGINLLLSLPLSKEEKAKWIDILVKTAVLHDIGKIHKDFISAMEGERTGIRHELVSLLLCINYLQLDDNILFAIATHHRGVVNMSSDTKGTLKPNQIGKYMEYWYEADSSIFQSWIIKEWLELFDLDDTVIEQESIKKLPKELKAIFYANHQIEAVPEIEKRKEFSQIRALLMAADHLGSAGKENDIPKYKRLKLEDFQPNKEGVYFSFRPFQERLRYVNSDVILHAPTGSGKTEAALNWVYANQTENCRLFYLLPYTASINAMVTRLQNHYNDEVVTALHSKTLDFFFEQLSEEYSNNEKDYQKIEQEARDKKTLSKELFYPVKVATLHQVLKTSLKGKGWEFALFDYQNALFIIDEFHTYDALLTGMLLATIKLFKKLFNAKFFFMSATIPDFMLQLIIDKVYGGDRSVLMRPDRTKEEDRIVMDRKRHQLYCMKNANISDRIELIKRYLKEDRTVLIIVNNVKSAQDLYREIKFNGSVQLLHGGLNKRDRTLIEKSITNKNKSLRPQLLIATQAVEVSLDIDYNVAFIENAPIDALIQRFGRVNRAGRKKISPIDREVVLDNKTVPVYVFEKSIGRTPFYNDEVLKKTWEELSYLDNSELGEDDLVKVCNKVYDGGYNEDQKEDFNNGFGNSIIDNFEKDWIAGHWRDWIEDILENDNQKIEVLCYNLIEEYRQKIKERRFIEANQLLVSVYQYEANITTEREFGDTPTATNLYYDPTIGYVTTDNTDARVIG